MVACMQGMYAASYLHILCKIINCFIFIFVFTYIGTSPVVYKSLSKGQHRITVKARCPCAGPVVRHSKFQIK